MFGQTFAAVQTTPVNSPSWGWHGALSDKGLADPALLTVVQRKQLKSCREANGRSWLDTL